MSADAPLRVVHAALSLRASYGGPARSIPALADALAARGVGVDLLTVANDAPGDPLRLPRDARVRVTRVNGVLDPKGLALWIPAFRREVLALASGEGVVLHDHGLWRPTNHAMATVAAATRAPLVVSPRGMLSGVARAHRSARKRAAWALWARRDLARARALHATSPGEAAELATLGLKLPVAMIPNGVALPALAAPPDAARAARTLLFLGRLVAVKGLDLLLDAWRIAAPAGWQLVIAGPDEDGTRATLERALAERPPARPVHFAGALDDDAKWAALAAADALVLPSRTESFGVVVAEALAAARPVIATTATPWPTLATRGAGWLADTTPEALAHAITRCAAATDAERAAMGVRGRAWAEADFGWDGVATRMVALYHWLRHGGPAPDTVTVP